MLESGSRWASADGKVFIIITTTTIDGHDWVYYRSERPVDHLPKEFSCYTESFLSRFSKLPE